MSRNNLSAEEWLELMKSTRTQWLTAAELAAAVGKSRGVGRAVMEECVEQGFLRSRRREKDDPPPRGSAPREYALSREWGGQLDDEETQ